MLFASADFGNVGFKDLGGHAIFDATIVCANILGALREPAASAVVVEAKKDG